MQLPPTNLPRELSSFIGREQEIATVMQLLRQAPLVTLTGSGGCGKTRLALKIAAEVRPGYPHGVWLVDLAALTEPRLLASTVAQVLGIKEQAGQTIQQMLLDTLKSKSLLLLIDNCEHLLAACAQLVAVLLRSCPNIKVLATSRETLGIGGEQTYRVSSLTTPDLTQKATPESLVSYEAARLFIDRARSHKPDFTVTNANAPALAQLCHQLDGIPLALELAAARVRSLPVEEINTRVDNRFRLLKGGDRAALPRHQTLRALIDWSYDLLNVREKALFCRLSVFMGGWMLEAAEQVGAGENEAGEHIEDWEVFDLLTSIVDKSLVLTEERGNSARYRFLETVRQYGRDRLGESGEDAAVRTRHRNYFVEFAEVAEPRLVGAEQREWLNRLEAEHENLRVGLEWCLTEGNSTAGFRLCGALGRYWQTRGHLTEGREWCERTLGRSKGNESALERAKALNWTGNLATSQGDFVSACAYHEESLTIYREMGNQEGIANSLCDMGVVAYSQGDYASARNYYEESLTIYREIGNQSGIANCLGNLGNAIYSQGDFVSACAYHEESLTIYREIGNQAGIASSLGSLGLVADAQSDYASARTYYEESLTIYREIGNQSGIANCLCNMGNVATFQGDYLSACAYLEASLTIYREIGNQKGIANCLCNMGNATYGKGDYAATNACFEESLTIHRKIGDQKGIAASLCNIGTMAYFQRDYAASRACFEESLAIRRGTGDQAGIAISLQNLGIVAAAQGNNAVARACFEESLPIRSGIGDQKGVSELLEEYARLAFREERSEQAAKLWAAAGTLREHIGAPLPPDEREAYKSEVAQVRQVLGEAAFAAAWIEGRAMTMEQAIEFALGEG